MSGLEYFMNVIEEGSEEYSAVIASMRYDH